MERVKGLKGNREEQTGKSISPPVQKRKDVEHDLFASCLLDQQNQLLTGTTLSWQTALRLFYKYSPSMFTTNNNKHRKRNRKCIFLLFLHKSNC